MMNLSELFSKHVHPDHKVVCMGSEAHPRFDPSPLQVGLILARGAGSFFILDSQAQILQARLEQRKYRQVASQAEKKLLAALNSLDSRGIGDPLEHRKELKKIAAAGGAVKIPRVKLASALKTGFGDKQFDVLIDAGSLPWIRRAEYSKHRQKKLATELLGQGVQAEPNGIPVEEVLAEYGRIAKKAMFLCKEGTYWPYGTSELKQALKKTGLKFEEHDVENRYELEIPPKAVPYATAKNGKAILSHGHQYDKAIVVEFR